MNLKFVLKALSFPLLTAFVFAEKTNDCDDIKNYFDKKNDEINYENIIEKCIMDDQGNVIQLTVVNYSLQEEDVNKILSYKTLKDLTYNVKYYVESIENNSYASKIIEHPGYSKFPTAIANLPELETLVFNNDRTHYIKYEDIRENIPIETGSLKLSKKLKKLSISQVDFSSQNMKELSELTNLETSEFNYCNFENVDLNSLEKLETLTVFGSKVPNNMKIKSLKNLYLTQISCDDSVLYDFNGLENLELMNVMLDTDCKFDTSKLQKLSELHFEGDPSFFGKGLGSEVSLKAPNSLKKLSFSKTALNSDNYKEISTLPNLEELTINYCDKYESPNIDIKSLACHDKLVKLYECVSFCISTVRKIRNLEKSLFTF